MTLRELLTDTGFDPMVSFIRKCEVKISTSSNYPLSQEINSIRTMVKPWIADVNPLVMQGVDESLGCELGIFLVGVENLPE